MESFVLFRFLFVYVKDGTMEKEKNVLTDKKEGFYAE